MKVLDVDGFDDNYCALALCILLNWPPERAFEYLETGRIQKNRWHTEITDGDVRDMMKLRQRMTYQEIGQIYNMSAGSVYRRIKRYKNRREIG